MSERCFYEQGFETGRKPEDHRKRCSFTESRGLLEFLIAVEDGTLLLNGERQREPYDNSAFPDTSSFGPVPFDRIEDEALMSFLPPSRVELL
jgi:hypothetical protein